MLRYKYEGPVYQFQTCISSKWVSETVAISEAKAKINLAYRYKKEHGLTANSNIKLPGKLTVAE